MRLVLCILLLEWSTTSQRLWAYRISVLYAQKDPRFLSEKKRGQRVEFWSLISTIDGSTQKYDYLKICVGNTNMLVSKNAKICVTPNTKPKMCVFPPTRIPQCQSVEYRLQSFCFGHVRFFFCVSISFAFGCCFSVEYGLKSYEHI